MEKRNSISMENSNNKNYSKIEWQIDVVTPIGSQVAQHYEGVGGWIRESVSRLLLISNEGWWLTTKS